MKILFFIDSMNAGGKERRLTELMKALKLNEAVHFELVVMNDFIHYKEILQLGIKVHYLVRSTKKDVRVFQKFYNICKSFKPDIVHCWDSMTAVYAVPACKLLNIKLVNGMVVDTPVKQNVSNKHWLRARFIFPFANIVIGNSRAGLTAYGAAINKSVCIYNGMDLKRFKNLMPANEMRVQLLGKGSETFFIAGMVAAFEERKDYKTLISAAIEFVSSNDDARFLLVGDGADLEAIKKAVPPSVRDKIIFLGKRTDIESIVNSFDVGILLTNTGVHGEGISNSIIEYMALGKPVIATRGGGTNEVVIDGQNGFLIDAHKKDQLLEKLKLLMANKKLQTELGQRGIEMVHEKFDIKNMTAQYVHTYQKLLKEKTNA